MKRELTLPISAEAARKLCVGDILYLTGQIFTARDEAHQRMLEHHETGKPILFDPASMALFHCGPVVRKIGNNWDVIAAGPTTSVRMELFEDRFLEAFGTKVVIGKGGMGEKTQAALKRCGAAYTHYTGGAGALAARAIERVESVYWLEELGMAEAVWILRVNRFGPLLVTMDSAGGNLYTDLAKTIAKNQQAIHAKIAG
jgi:tartrate/fumarate subfamily iron-sulfur-dependent hydro-lyase beta chain